MEHYTNDTIIARMAANYIDIAGYYEYGCNNKTTDLILPKFTFSDALLIKLLDLRR